MACWRMNILFEVLLSRTPLSSVTIVEADVFVEHFSLLTSYALHLLHVDIMTTSTTAVLESSPDSMVLGRRLLPTWIDKVGRENPEKVWAIMPRSTDLKDGFCEYQYRHLVAAIDTLAWWIESTIGRSTTCETVAYMGSHFT